MIPFHQGMQMTIGGTVKTIYGTLLAVSGDNLGGQLIGGYKQLASATRKCRFCMATAEDMNKKVCIELYMTTPYA